MLDAKLVCGRAFCRCGRSAMRDCGETSTGEEECARRRDTEQRSCGLEGESKRWLRHCGRRCGQRVGLEGYDARFCEGSKE